MPPPAKDIDPQDVPRPVYAIGAELVTTGIEHPPHAHRKAQLIMALRGLVTCEVSMGRDVLGCRRGAERGGIGKLTGGLDSQAADEVLGDPGWRLLALR